MKNFSLHLITIICFACQPQDQSITVSNPSNTTLTDKVIIVSREMAPSLDGNKHPVIVNNGDTLLSQLDDLDQDGQWDEMAFLVDLEPGEVKKLSLGWNDLAPASQKTRTNIRFAKKMEDNSYQELSQEIRPVDHTKASPTVNYQMEGPAWENDKVAFRMYFDPRNGFDIFGKTSREMVLDQVGISGNYHELQDWGMDILKVNNSLGAGALALQWQDSLYRLAETDEAYFKVITEGPVRSILELNYKNWKIKDVSLELNQKIIIEAGKYYYSSEITTDNLPENSGLGTGIVNIYSDTIYEDTAEEMKIMATHAPQAFNGEYLGMAIMAKQNQFRSVQKTPEKGPGITQTYVMVFNSNSHPVKFHFFAGWELSDPEFANKDSFIKKVEDAAKQLQIMPEVRIN